MAQLPDLSRVALLLRDPGGVQVRQRGATEIAPGERMIGPASQVATSASTASCRLSALTELMTVGRRYWADATPGEPSVTSSTPAAESRLTNVDDIGYPLGGRIFFWSVGHQQECLP